MCLIRHKNKILVSKGYDKVKAETFYRFLGGSLEFNETIEYGIEREIKEELGSDINDLHLLDVIQNIFTYEGEKRHQLVFLYKGNLSDKSLYEKNVIHITDATVEFDAEWMPLERVINREVILYPQYDYSNLLR